MDGLQNFLKVCAGIVTGDGLRYFLVAGFGWLFFFVLFRRRWMKRKINLTMPSGSQMRREMFYSALSLLMFAIVGASTLFMAKAGWTRMYFNITDRSWYWFAGSVLGAIFLHDTYFYWMHRAIHHPRIFKLVHLTHHRSVNPSPWAAYSFHPIEAFLEALIFPLVVFLIPIHPVGFLMFAFWEISFNVLGHAGFEIYPRWLMDTWFGKFLNTPTAHVLHHETARANYGIYFNFWDRLMGTNHDTYEDRFREVTGRTG